MGNMKHTRLKGYCKLILISISIVACSKEKRADKAGEKMQEFVINISDYARACDSDFIVIPQNGAELAFNNLAPEDGLSGSYLSAIDGIGIEELFYNGTYAPDNERLTMLQQVVLSKQIMVSEYIANNNAVADAITKNLNEGFICFPRTSGNYDYMLIPDSVTNENTNDITTLADAKNYLYLISSSSYATRQEFIHAIAATNFDVVLIDLFYGDTRFSATEIQQLKTKANGGKRLVICYMNIGAAERYRYYWKSNWKLHHPNWLKKTYEGYEDEIWVKFWKKEWQEIIYGNDNSYTKKILDAGFDGVYLDNVEAYYFLYFD